LTVRRRHAGEADAPIAFKGTVGNVKRKDLAESDIVARPLTASFKRAGLRLTWSRGCPHALYDNGCKVKRDLFKVPAVVTVKTGTTITVNTVGALAQGWFDGGYLDWVANADGSLDRRGIERSLSATQFLLLGTSDRIEVGTAVNLYPGCDLTAEMCDSKFDNLANHGGFGFMTGKSPFDGSPVF
jgi:uncharacterized phage protein (TIGR02218 family)